MTHVDIPPDLSREMAKKEMVKEIVNNMAFELFVKVKATQISSRKNNLSDASLTDECFESVRAFLTQADEWNV